MPTLLPNTKRASKSKKGYKKTRMHKPKHMAHGDSITKRQLLNPNIEARKRKARLESGRHYSNTSADNT